MWRVSTDSKELPTNESVVEGNRLHHPGELSHVAAPGDHDSSILIGKQPGTAIQFVDHSSSHKLGFEDGHLFLAHKSCMLQVTSRDASRRTQWDPRVEWLAFNGLLPFFGTILLAQREHQHP